mgnify:FL=1
MAITMRHGPYNKFDPQKLRTGELAAVTEGDPHASDGKAIYQCFSPGDVKRMATYEDMLDQIDEAGGEAIDNHIEEKVGAALKACENATKAAQDAKTNADKAVSSANTAASSANTAANTASKAAEDCKNLIDEKHVAEIEKAVQQSLMADAIAGTVTGKTVTDLPENTAPADTDYFLGATGNAMKKTKVSQLIAWLKEKLGINDLNTNLLKVKELGVSASVSANTDKNIAVNWGLPADATIVAYFIEKVVGSGNTTNITYAEFTLLSNIRVKSTSAQTVTITAACLYK